mgnify:CR=1 FL=1
MDELYMAEKRQNNIAQAVKDYGRRLFRFIRSKVGTDADAEDILQDVWYQFANTSATQTVEQVSSWLFKVARNRITDKYRKRKTESLDEYDEDEEDSFAFREILFTPSQDHEMQELQQLFWEALFSALDELPAPQREAFVLNELEDMTLQQIADKTGDNIKTIISRKRYAVQHLRTRLQYLYDTIVNY